ncbi:hypothetical protein D5F51_07135 [Yersinia hibernica]|uniref:Uncharacterized protein n=1 Tax=Yersinia hibernica TaxID=2339259 RepID=A0ABX5QYM1_9GAMM|nr:hypothetical protein D5F51_07135 [Yersinia hibernica]
MAGVSVSLPDLINESCAILPPRVMTQQQLRLSVVQADLVIIPLNIRDCNDIPRSFCHLDKGWQRCYKLIRS